ncbi:MAG: TonB-dependent siderophore receptor [Steroidobacteraceae bacterium]
MPHRSLNCALALLCIATPIGVHAETASTESDLETVLILAKRADRISKGATGLDLEIKDTPQSISVVTREQMNDFGADNLNDALRLATGINVEEWETNRTNYMARGFDIKSTQVDGVGLPNDWGIVTGEIDSFGFEKLEVIRGANGLLTGVGNSAGTINYVRKRPTNEPQGSVAVIGGSFDRKRIEADYSTPFTESGSWAGRLVVAAEDEDSYVRGMKNNRTFVYGVVDGQLGDESTLTAGYSYQDANTDGNMWGALVLAYSDGTQAEFERNASTAQDWSMWDTLNRQFFIEYTYALPADWNLRATYNHRSYTEESKLFFAYSMTGIDRATGLGLLGWPGAFPTKDEADLVDLTLDGHFGLFGRQHEAMIGIAYSKDKLTTLERVVDLSDPAFSELPAFPYRGDAIAEPVWGPEAVSSILEPELKRVYGVTRLSLTDKLSGIVGFNWVEYHRDGETSDVPFDQTERELSPYAGLTYAFTPDLLVYASYSDIYQPQDYYDINGNYLDPTKGVNYEVGLKAEWLDNRVLTTLAWFKAKQEGLGTFAGMSPDQQYFYEGMDVDSKGVELEITGRLNEHIDVVLGFTSLKLEDPDGGKIYEWVPRKTVNLAVKAVLPVPAAVSVGLSGRWQSRTSKLDEYTNVVIAQDNYATLNAFAKWNITQQMSVRGNVDNLTDKKYITSLYQVGYYAAPRNYSVGFTYEF